MKIELGPYIYIYSLPETRSLANLHIGYYSALLNVNRRMQTMFTLGPVPYRNLANHSRRVRIHTTND